MKPRTLNDAILKLDGKLYCAFCGTEISSVENGCSCNRFKYVKNNMPMVEGYRAKVDEYKNRAEQLIASMPDINYQVESTEAIVTFPKEPPVGEDNEESTEGE